MTVENKVIVVTGGGTGEKRAAGFSYRQMKALLPG
jgi:hypothetical protein